MRPRSKDIDHNKTQTGDDLRDFVNLNLFPYPHAFKQKATGPNRGEYYTPRPLIRPMAQVPQPKIGETIYDAASGSGPALHQDDPSRRTRRRGHQEYVLIERGQRIGQPASYQPRLPQRRLSGKRIRLGQVDTK